MSVYIVMYDFGPHDGGISIEGIFTSIEKIKQSPRYSEWIDHDITGEKAGYLFEQYELNLPTIGQRYTPFNMKGEQICAVNDCWELF